MLLLETFRTEILTCLDSGHETLDFFHREQMKIAAINPLLVSGLDYSNRIVISFLAHVLQRLGWRFAFDKSVLADCNTLFEAMQCGLRGYHGEYWYKFYVPDKLRVSVSNVLLYHLMNDLHEHRARKTR